MSFNIGDKHISTKKKKLLQSIGPALIEPS